MGVILPADHSKHMWRIFFGPCERSSYMLLERHVDRKREREREKERTKKIEELKGETFLDDDKINRVGKHFFQTEAEKMKSAEFASSGWDTFSNKAKSTFFHLHSFFPPTSVKLQAKRR